MKSRPDIESFAPESKENSSYFSGHLLAVEILEFLCQFVDRLHVRILPEENDRSLLLFLRPQIQQIRILVFDGGQARGKHLYLRVQNPCIRRFSTVDCLGFVRSASPRQKALSEV